MPRPSPRLRARTPRLLCLALAPLVASACSGAAPTAAAPREATPAPAGSPLAATIPHRPPPAAAIAALADISPERMKRDVETLAGFGTRHTLSDTESKTRGIGAARRWIKAELEAAAASSGRSGAEAMQVSFDSHRVEPDGKRVTRAVDVVNVVAILPGTMPRAAGRRYYVVGHYDSRRTDPLDATGDSPGANDDASGTAVVIELARVLSRHRFDATLVFMATAGEEQGLLGAKGHAVAARAAGADIRGVLSNDIVGDPTSAIGAAHRDRVRVFSEALPDPSTPEQIAELRRVSGEGDTPSRQLARYVAEVAAWHDLAVQPQVILRYDRVLRGGDHLAFGAAGYPAVRFTVVDEHYDRQHQDVRSEGGVAFGDVPAFVDGPYLAGVARVNGAALVHLASAPSAPGDARVVVAGLANDTTLRWSASPEPDVAGYEVLWRETTSSFWQHSRDVGRTGEAHLPLNRDNWFFAVRAYDADGYRSPAAFPRMADK
ncbi:MAG TPA: M28 family metallopeptidase [Kofleriaceae bacterium]|nr:M28 family metallopeptidase [Kofleriaceae bacterium]